MTPKEFIFKYYPYALEVEKETGIHAAAILTQAGLETGWGKHVVGNMFFGVKDTDGINGNEQLVSTREVLRTPFAKFPFIHWVRQIGKNLYEYFVKDYFRKYASPADSFRDYAIMISNNPRYAKAMMVKDNPLHYLQEVARAGYATDPNYEMVCINTCNIILHLINIYNVNNNNETAL